MNKKKEYKDCGGVEIPKLIIPKKKKTSQGNKKSETTKKKNK